MDTVLAIAERLLEVWREMPSGEEKETLKNDLIEVREIAIKNCLRNGMRVEFGDE